MKRLLSVFTIICISGAMARAQSTSCAQNLRLAQATYEQGRLHEVPLYVKTCTESGSVQEKVTAYKLLCLSYIYLEEPEKADEAMLNLLRTDHEFSVNESTDPAEFIALYRTFRTKPIYRLGLKLGVNATQPNVVSYVPANDGESKYGYALGFQAGFSGEIPVADKLTFNPELVLSLRNFTYENKATYTEMATGSSRTFTTTGTEKQTWVTLPLLMQYEIASGKFNPYVSAGVSIDYLLTANNTFQRTKQEATSLEEQTLDIKSDRKPINIGALVALGSKVKVKGGFLVAELRYMYGLTKVNDKASIYNSFNKTFPTAGYVDGIFKLNAVSLSVGYTYNIFNPKKLKK